MSSITISISLSHGCNNIVKASVLRFSREKVLIEQLYILKYLGINLTNQVQGLYIWQL